MCVGEGGREGKLVDERSHKGRIKESEDDGTRMRSEVEVMRT